MSLRKLNSLVFVAVLVIAAASCKKDDETETLPSLSGLTFDCPSFVAPGQAVRMTPGGVKHPEGGEVGYSWIVTPTMTSKDTTDVFIHWFSDTLKTYNVYCYAFAEGYTGATYSRDVMVVKGGLDGSLTDTGIKAGDKKINYGGIDYYYVKIGELDWFRNNLASTSSGTPYVNEEITSDIFGRFYNYNEAMTACPEGWRLPTEDDWMSLAEAMGVSVEGKYESFADVTSKLLANASFNGVAMLEYWPEVGDIDNESRLSLMPFGFANLGNATAEGKYPSASFEGIFDYSVYWTADEVDGEDEMAYYRYLISDQPDMFVGQGDVNTFGASVRCVRDAK